MATPGSSSLNTTHEERGSGVGEKKEVTFKLCAVSEVLSEDDSSVLVSRCGELLDLQTSLSVKSPFPPHIRLDHRHRLKLVLAHIIRPYETPESWYSQSVTWFCLACRVVLPLINNLPRFGFDPTPGYPRTSCERKMVDGSAFLPFERRKTQHASRTSRNPWQIDGR